MKIDTYILLNGCGVVNTDVTLVTEDVTSVTAFVPGRFIHYTCYLTLYNVYYVCVEQGVFFVGVHNEIWAQVRF